MSREIFIKVDNVCFTAELYDTITADKIWDALPLTGDGKTWGEEVYFDTNVISMLDETSTLSVKLGEIGYWPPGKAFCIFYGMTPASTPDQIRPASAVNIIGKVTSNLDSFKIIKDGCNISVIKQHSD